MLSSTRPGDTVLPPRRAEAPVRPVAAADGANDPQACWWAERRPASTRR